MLKGVRLEWTSVPVIECWVFWGERCVEWDFFSLSAVCASSRRSDTMRLDDSPQHSMSSQNSSPHIDGETKAIDRVPHHRPPLNVVGFLPIPQSPHALTIGCCFCKKDATLCWTHCVRIPSSTGHISSNSKLTLAQIWQYYTRHTFETHSERD